MVKYGLYLAEIYIWACILTVILLGWMLGLLWLHRPMTTCNLIGISIFFGMAMVMCVLSIFDVVKDLKEE